MVSHLSSKQCYKSSAVILFIEIRDNPPHPHVNTVKISPKLVYTVY